MALTSNCRRHVCVRRDVAVTVLMFCTELTPAGRIPRFFGSYLLYRVHALNYCGLLNGYVVRKHNKLGQHFALYYVDVLTMMVLLNRFVSTLVCGWCAVVRRWQVSLIPRIY